MGQRSIIEEIVSLNIDDLDIAELEHRLEMVALLPGIDGTNSCSANCSCDGCNVHSSCCGSHCSVNGGGGGGCPRLC